MGQRIALLLVICKKRQMNLIGRKVDVKYSFLCFEPEKEPLCVSVRVQICPQSQFIVKRCSANIKIKFLSSVKNILNVLHFMGFEQISRFES